MKAFRAHNLSLGHQKNTTKLKQKGRTTIRHFASLVIRATRVKTITIYHHSTHIKKRRPAQKKTPTPTQQHTHSPELLSPGKLKKWRSRELTPHWSCLSTPVVRMVHSCQADTVGREEKEQHTAYSPRTE